MNFKNLFALASLFLISACSSGGADTTPTPPVDVNRAPVVDAGADATIRLPTDTAALDGTVTDDGLPSGASVSTSWSVTSGPAGATFADVNAVDTTVTFATEGTYVLELAADDTALTGTDTVTIIVEAAPALASIAVAPTDASLLTGGTQAFTASGTDQYGDPIATTITWSATGGTIDQAGNYTAGGVTGSFLVTATEGAISGTANVTISDSPPTADAGGPYMGVEGAPVALDGSASSDANNDIVAYDWDLDNDGAYDDATGVNPTFAAGASGVFTIGLRVTDGDGASDSATTTVTISNVAPTANAGGPYSGDQGANITLDGSGSSDPGNDIVSYEWDLDNDGTYETPGVSATFNSAVAGAFTVGLRVTDNDGAAGTASVGVTVNDLAPIADAGGPYSGDQGADIALDGSASSDPSGIATYEWDLDDNGTYETPGVNATFNSATAGTFTVGLQVTDNDGSTGNTTVDVTVNDTAPVADAGGPYSGDQGADITLDGSASSDSSGIASYEWDLDNDGTYETPGVTATFNSVLAGTFTVGLQVTDNDGSTATDTADVTVNDLAPVADAGGPYSGDQGADIALDGSASSDPSGIASYDWDLDNDMTYETPGVNATFNSAAPGIFTVGLQVTDNDGSTGTDTVDVMVNDIPPAAPGGVSASAGDTQVTLDWADNSEPDLAGTPYTVSRATIPGGPYTEVVTALAASAYVDGSVTNDITYYYFITADDAAGNTSANSAEVSVTPNGPIQAYWTFEDGPGATTADTALADGNSGSGTLVGATFAVGGGVSGSGLDLDGTAGHVVIDDNPHLRITGTAITMTAWIFPRDGGASGGSRIISKRTDAGGSDVFAMITDEYRLKFRLDGQDLTSSHIFRLDDWVHVAMV